MIEQDWLNDIEPLPDAHEAPMGHRSHVARCRRATARNGQLGDGLRREGAEEHRHENARQTFDGDEFDRSPVVTDQATHRALQRHIDAQKRRPSVGIKAAGQLPHHELPAQCRRRQHQGRCERHLNQPLARDQGRQRG